MSLALIGKRNSRSPLLCYYVYTLNKHIIISSKKYAACVQYTVTK